MLLRKYVLVMES
nr:truncated ribosomal protein L16 [Cycas revoluta]